MNKTEVAIICSRLDLPGGIERAVINLANLLCEKGHRVTIVVADVTARSFYPIHNDITILQIPLHFGITARGNVVTRKLALLNHILTLRKTLKEINARIIISTDNVLSIATWLATYNLNKRMFSWEHHHFHWLKKNRFWTFLFNKIYPRIECIICLNKTEQRLYQSIGCTAIVIPNFLPLGNYSISTLKNKQLLTVGWLNWRKGVDMIPKIARLLFNKHKDWKWKIIGSGEYYDQLNAEIQQYDLTHYIDIVKPQTFDINNEYATASIYIMTSRFECFPMVLLEASAHSLPIVSFDCPTGPADILEDGITGYLAPLNNVESIASKIQLLIENETKRIEMGIAALAKSKDFHPDPIYLLWQQLFEGKKNKAAL